MIRNIVFDMGHVLLWFRPQEACASLLENKADAQAVYTAFFGGPLWADVDHGFLDGEAFTGAVKALLPTRLHPAVDMLYREMPENVMVPVAGMANLVDELIRQGYNVYLLSNAGLWMSRRRDMIPHIERFRGVMFSADEKLIKPDPRLYRRLTEQYSLKPEECFFIDDKEENTRAAAELGWQTHIFTGDLQALQTALDAL